ncbi:MAG: metal-dependent hydrolase, partial [Polyangiaceae bacterium]|nr:metal-dependent hydrolase [Polyangiaceae bacterium]
RRRARPDAEPANPKAVLGLAFLSVLTHPFLDWLNTYGVRLLMPFDDRWFYGDSVFIVDPWLWLSMGAAVVLARSAGKPSMAAWLVLGCGASAFVLGTGFVPIGAQLLWAVGVGAIVALRASGRPRERVERVARVCIAALAIYLSLNVAGAHIARDEVRSWLADRGMHADTGSASPVPANPFVREVIALVGDEYHFVRRSWFGEPGFAFSNPPIALGPRDAIARAALDAPSVRGLRGWLRFPAIEVERADDGYVVTIRDVRYGRRGPTALGTAVVRLDDSLQPL